jgi:hypothetical protein
VDKEKLLHGDELFRSVQYASVMDKGVLHTLYKDWKKNKLMRILPSVLRDQYEKEAEEPEDAVKRMIATDPGWMQWTAQMHSQVHDTMGSLKPQKKMKMLDTLDKKNKNVGGKAANVSNSALAVVEQQQASKPVDFNIMLTDLLSSAAVDQAAEELYRRGQAEIDSVEAIGRARRGDDVPHNVPANVAISDAPWPAGGNGRRESDSPPWPADSPPKNERPGSTKESEKAPPGAGVGLDEINVELEREDSVVLPPPRSDSHHSKASMVIGPPRSDSHHSKASMVIGPPRSDSHHSKASMVIGPPRSDSHDRHSEA